MAVPKRRHSKSRTRKRRSTKGIVTRTIGQCSQCHQPKLSHRVCPHCGAYAGKTAVAQQSQED